jgi:beta-galactosidase
MVRLWTWEAFAHGAEAVCYFRWRQAPFAQEQMHAGLLRPDSAPAPALAEAARVARELAAAPQAGCAKGDVALVFDYESAWAWATQPHGADFDYFRLCFAWYRALRALGLNIDIIAPDVADLSDWRLVLGPGLFTLSGGLRAALGTVGGQVVLGPRANSRTQDFAIPVPLAPNLPGLDARVIRVQSLPPGVGEALQGGGQILHWLEDLEGSAEVTLRRADGSAAMMRAGRISYLAGWPDDATLRALLARLCAEEGITTTHLPPMLRLRDAGGIRYLFNHGAEAVTWQGHSIPAADFVTLPIP